MKKNTPNDHPDWNLLNNAIPAMQSVADHVDKNIQQARNKLKLVELSSGGANSLLLAHRNLVAECELKCEHKKKTIAFYVFNDVLVHLSTTKAKHKANLTKTSAQWPLPLIWFQYSSQDSVQIVGPTDYYLIKFGSPESNHFITTLHDAVDKELKQQSQKRNSNASIPTIETPARHGSYQFANSVFYDGQWVNGKVCST